MSHRQVNRPPPNPVEEQQFLVLVALVSVGLILGLLRAPDLSLIRRIPSHLSRLPRLLLHHSQSPIRF